VIEACRLPVSNELVPFINSEDDEVGNAAVQALRQWSPEIGDALFAACMSKSGYRSQLAKDKLGHLLARSPKGAEHAAARKEVGTGQGGNRRSAGADRATQRTCTRDTSEGFNGRPLAGNPDACRENPRAN
jgi:hypothetical protein